MDNIQAVEILKANEERKLATDYCRIKYMAISALEKQILIKHHHTRIDEVHDKARTSVCPSCLGCIITRVEEYPKFCTWCGQAIDWSDVNG